MSLLRSGPMVQLAGMTSSVPYHGLQFGPSRHRGANYIMATWLPRDRKPAQVAKWGEGGGEGGGGGEGRQRKWRGGQFPEEDEGETRRTEKGRGLIGGGDELDFWSRLTTHNSLNKTWLLVCTGQTTGLIYWYGLMLHQGHTYHKILWQATQNKTGRLEWGGEGGGGNKGMGEGGNREDISEWPCWWWNMDYHRSNMWMYKVCHVWPTSCFPSIHASCMAKTLTLDNSAIFLPNSVIPTTFMDTTSHYQFVPLSVALILAEGVKVSEKQHMLE